MFYQKGHSGDTVKKQSSYNNIQQLPLRSELSQALEVLNSKTENTFVLCPMDDKICIQVGQHTIFQEKGLIAFRNAQHYSTYPVQDTLIAFYAQNEAFIDSVEQKKFFQEAKQQKPQTAQQLAQEQLFELNDADLAELEDKKYETQPFLIGDECLTIQPSHCFHVHRIFGYDGHLNTFTLGAQSSRVIAEMLLEKYTQLVLERLGISLGDEKSTDGNSEYNNVSKQAFNTKSNKNFQKSISEMFSTDSGLQMIVVVPDTTSAAELESLQNVFLNRLGFSALLFIPKSHADVIGTGQVQANQTTTSNQTPRQIFLDLNIGLVSSNLTLMCPGCPALHRRSQAVPQCSLALLQTFLHLLIGAIQDQKQPSTVNQGISSLEKLRQVFFVAVKAAWFLTVKNGEISDELLETLRILIPDLSSPQSDEQLRSYAENIIFQAENNLIDMILGKQRIFSLKVDDNRQGSIKIIFPDTRTGFKLSFALGPLGLASAYALVYDSMVSVPFSSWKPNVVPTLLKDVSGEHKAVKGTGKQTDVTVPEYQFQLYGRPVQGLINRQQLQKQPQAYISQISSQHTRAPLSEMLRLFMEALLATFEQKETILRSFARPGELADEASKKALLTDLESFMKQNVILSGQLFMAVPHFGETILNAIGCSSAVSDKSIGTYVSYYGGTMDAGRKATALAALSAATDNVTECFMSREEAELIGTRLWHEKVLFTWPRQ